MSGGTSVVVGSVGRPRRRVAGSAVRSRPRSDAGVQLADRRVAAWSLAALLVIGGLLGSANLLVDGVLRPGAGQLAYAATMAFLVALGAGLAVRRRVGPRETAVLVVVGDVVYVVVAWSVTDPRLYAPPLMLLFCCAVAAWFLGPRVLALHMTLVVVGSAAGLAGSYPTTAALAVQVAAASLVLDVVTLGIFLLRRRVQRLLADTRELSTTDPLTGLVNRRYLVEQAPRIWRQARRDGQRVVALVLDLDRFKQLNDEHGHATGDAVLTDVARALAASVRPSDVLARIGGEEMVVLGLVSDPGESRRLGERLRHAVATSGAGQEWGVTVSIGAALTRPTGTEAADDEVWKLIDRADAAMYEAKQSGRDRVVLAAGVAVP